MVRTEIRLPNEVYAQAKRLAAAEKISFAELARRGIELVLGQAPRATDKAPPWRPPVVKGMGWRGSSHEEIRDAARQTAFEEDLEERAARHAGI